MEEVDRYRRAKERERDALRARREAQLARPEAERERLPRPLSNGSINKTIRLLAVVLEQAVEYGYVMAQAGHTDPKTTLGIYAQVIASGTDHGAALDGLVEASDWAAMGSESGEGALVQAEPSRT